MLTVGCRFPKFNLTSVVSNTDHNDFIQINNSTYQGKWLCVFFWPKDFTFVCPTEIAAFGKISKDFADRNCQILGCSTDSEFVHLAWRQHNNLLKDLSIPMMSDIKRHLCNELGVLNHEAGVAMRATFLVDPNDTIRYVDVTDMKVGRNPSEVLRVLDALQTDALCPCDWQPGDKTL